MNYDIIGDIHGHADALKALLTRLGYAERHGAWRHPERKVLFLGDFIDVGPAQLETVGIVRGMVDADSALAVMGNHELNAIAWFLPDGKGGYLREHRPDNYEQHKAFLAEVGNDDALHEELVEWFLTLPLWLELPELRAVHACWHPVGRDFLTAQLAPGHRLTRELMPQAVTEPANKAEKDTPAPTMFKAVEWITKGIEIPMPPGTSFVDKNGKVRDRVRIRWWDNDATTYRASALLSPAELAQQPDGPLPEHVRFGYDHPKPVFFGHYWWKGTPGPLAPKVACLDYSVARNGRLCAYSFDGEPVLDAGKFASVAPGFVANTDYDWFSFLAARQPLEEVNFWQPSGGDAFRALSPGEPFFFRLKKPHYAIGGFGLFARHEVISAKLAWEAFGERNGAPDFGSMCARIEKYRRDQAPDPSKQYRVGCLMISQPVFFDPADWVHEPADFSRNIVRGAGYDVFEGEGRRIWEACLERVRAHRVPLAAEESAQWAVIAGPRYGVEQIVRPRLGQGTFRIAVTQAYHGACAVSGEHSLPVLDVAHIRGYAEGGPHDVRNGLLLRADIHRLFDRGYVTVTPEYRFEVSTRLREEFENGKTYYALQGRVIQLPDRAADRPDPGLLQWHNEQVFARGAA